MKLLSELTWRESVNGNTWIASAYVGNLVYSKYDEGIVTHADVRVYKRDDGLFDIFTDCCEWESLDALTAQAILFHLTQGRNDDAG